MGAFKMANLSCTINFKSSQNLSFSSFVIIDNDVLNISGLFRLARYSDFYKKLILFCSLLYNFPVIMASSGVTEFIFGCSCQLLWLLGLCFCPVLFSLCCQ